MITAPHKEHYFAAIRSILNSFGQVVFQENILAGLFIVLAIGIHSLPLLCGALVGAIVSGITARLCQLNCHEIEAGLYGYCAILVGMACYYFYSFTIIAFVLAGLGSCVAVLITFFRLHRQRFLPSLTFAFVVSTWLIILTAYVFNIEVIPNPPAAAIIKYKFQEALIGLSQVFFLENYIAGVLILLAIAVNAWRVAIWVVAVALIGVYLPTFFYSPLKPSLAIAQGLYAFNAVLAVIYLVQILKTSAVFVMSGVLLSVLLTHLCLYFTLPIPFLTAPFILSSWFVYGIHKASLFSKSK